jgi:hypothetical protein
MPPIQAVKVVNGGGAAADRRGEPWRLIPPVQARRLRDRNRQPVHQVIHHSLDLPPGSKPRQAEPTVPQTAATYNLTCPVGRPNSG